MKPNPMARQSTKPGFDGLLSEWREFITESRRQVLRAVDAVPVQTCSGVGRHIVEFDQGGAARAEYGAKLLPRLAEKLTEEFGRGFDERNLHYMKRFYLAFPILNALRSELSWTHYRTLLRVEDEHAREWYANEAATQNWSSRALERQVSRLYYVRLLSSTNRKAVRAEGEEKIAELPPSPREFVRDPVLHGSEKLFATRYKLVLPSEEVLRLELIREQRALEERALNRSVPRKTTRKPKA